MVEGGNEVAGADDMCRIHETESTLGFFGPGVRHEMDSLLPHDCCAVRVVDVLLHPTHMQELYSLGFG